MKKEFAELDITRRALLLAMGALVRPAWASSAQRVAIARARTYGAEVAPALESLFDRLGGLGRLVKNKTVAIKINLTGPASWRLGYNPPELAQWVHPAVIGATVRLLDRAGARRIRLLESTYSSAAPLEEAMLAANWEPRDLLRAAPRVEMENTNADGGKSRGYARLTVPGGGYIYPGFDLNRSFVDCDVFISLAKMKQHATTGITLSLKNCFGMAPCTIYGEGAGVDEPSTDPHGGRNACFHRGARAPSKSAPGENDPSSPRDETYRVPRIVVDLVVPRPVHLAILDGIESMAGAEGPWAPGGRRISPGVLIAGLNPVATDAVAAAVMGFDPMADRGTPPFQGCDSTLRLAQQAGLGTRNLAEIEVLGESISKVTYPYRRL